MVSIKIIGNILFVSALFALGFYLSGYFSNDVSYNLVEDRRVFLSGNESSALVSVSLSGNGSGVVSSSPSGIVCGSDCSESFSSGTSVLLSAIPASGSVFTGWQDIAGTPTLAGSITKAEHPSYELNYALNVKVQGNYAYVGVNQGGSSTNGGIVIVNISNPLNPVLLGTLTTTQVGNVLNGVEKVFIRGDYLYVAANFASTGQGAFSIIDVSNPTNPILVGSVTNGQGGALLAGAFSVFVEGNYAYISSYYSHALEIIDISNPANPVHVSSIVDGQGGAELSNPTFIHVQGNYAYLTASSGNALEIIDISNPANPVHVSSIVDGQGGANLNLPSGVFVRGNYAYVSAFFGNALEIIDISNPANPVHVSSIVDGQGGAELSHPWPAFVAGNYAYIPVSEPGNALEIIDISNPSNPVHYAKILDGENGAQLTGARGIFVKDNFVYVAAAVDATLSVVDLGKTGCSGTGTCSFLISGPRSVRALFATGNQQTNNLSLVQLTNPASGSNYTAPALINLEATASDSDGSISSISFYEDSTLLGIDTTSPYTFSFTNSILGEHRYTAQATDNQGAVNISIPISVFIDANVSTVSTKGFTGAYYDMTGFKKLKFVRNDSAIDFIWLIGSPDARISKDTFSARWTGYLTPKISGEHIFYLKTNDGVRLWVNNVSLINQWQKRSTSGSWSAPITLVANQKYEIQLDYFENLGNAEVVLEWSQPGQQRSLLGNEFVEPGPLDGVLTSPSGENNQLTGYNGFLFYFSQDEPEGNYCGDGAIDVDEQCDLTNITQSCTDLGFTGGTLACNSDSCVYDTVQCTSSGNGSSSSDQILASETTEQTKSIRAKALIIGIALLLIACAFVIFFIIGHFVQAKRKRNSIIVQSSTGFQAAPR